MLERRDRDFTEWDFPSAVLDSVSSNIAVLDPIGVILAVNLPWREFAAANHMDDPACGVGANYLDVCRAARFDPNARAALEGIQGVIEGDLSSFYRRYPCHSRTEVRWFALRVWPLVDYPNFVVVSHENITEHVLARLVARPAR